MDTKDILDKLDSRADQATVVAIDSRVKSLEALMADVVRVDKVDKVVKVDDPAPDAELRKGVFDDIMAFKVWGIPVGEAAVGGFVAIFASELIDGFMSNQQPWQRGLVKLGAAGVAAKFGARFLGSTGSKAVALLLAFDAIRDFTPIDSWADQLAEKISGTVTTQGLAGAQTRGKPVNTSARPTGGQSFYSQALGG